MDRYIIILDLLFL